MTNMAYGQYCGLARALEVVGEPWALLVIRDLTISPKSFEALQKGMPGISASVLSARLRELEEAGAARARMPSRKGKPVLYELTEYGRDLEDIIVRLGRWGARTLGGPRREEVVTTSSMIMALRTIFRPEAARGVRVSYQINLGDIAIHACVNDGTLETGEGPLPDADIIIEAGPALKALMAGEISPKEAIETGGIRLRTGKISFSADPGLLAWFAEIFHITPAPFVRPTDAGRPVRGNSIPQLPTDAIAAGARG
jgi:DNA-binding HxlR family transcriptional regulator/putative sterol carrier protein